MTESLRVGTRRSPLALAQTELVVRALRQRVPDLRLEVAPLTTEGDRTRRIDGSFDFTDWIDRELEDGKIDLAVHSAKDLPARPLRNVDVAAYPRRADPRDCLVLGHAGRLRSLPAGARLGSSSLRRRAQLLTWRPDLQVVPIRGNVETRIEKIHSLGLDGVVLATAGLVRLGRADQISERLPLTRVLPAPGQGSLAVEVRRSDRSLFRVVRAIDDSPTRAAVTAERAVVSALGGDCNLPLGAYAEVRNGRLRLRARVFSLDGRRQWSRETTGSWSTPERIGLRAGRMLARSGAPSGAKWPES